MGLTEQQQRIVNAPGHEVLVVAGAGTGKTHTLVERYIALLEQHSVAELVAVTFTEAAAAEMRERVRRELSSRPRMAHHRAALDEAPIGTIHSLCFRVLVEHAAEAKIDPEARILAEDEAEYEVLAVCSDALEAASSTGDGALAILELSNEMGPDSVLPLLSGMVRARDDVAAAFAVMGETCEEVRAFASAACARHVAEASGRALRALDGVLEELLSARCSNTTDRLHDSWLAAIEALQALATGDHSPGQRRMWRERIKLYGQVGNWITPVQRVKDLVKAVRTQLEALDGVGWNEHDDRAVAATVALRDVFQDACARYDERKRRLGALDYLDLEIMARDLLLAHPATAAEYQSRFRHLLVDEFQDTNPIQVEIISLLAGDGAVSRFYVGDAQQAIYSFRGGDVRAFKRTRAALEGTGSVLPLSRSFRSHSGIVNAINAIFQDVFGEATEDYQAEFEQLYPREGTPPPGHSVTVMTVAPPQDGSNADDCTRFEAHLIAREIKSILQEGRPVWDGRTASWRPAEPGDIAIILRRFTKVGLFEDALGRAGLPHESQQGAGFFQRPEIRDLTNLLAWLAEEDDQIPLMGALRSPLFMLDDATLLRLRMPPRPFILALGDPQGFDPAETARLHAVHGILERLRGLAARESIDVLLAEALALTGFEASWAALPGGDRAVANIRKLVRMAQALRSRSLDEFVDYLVRRRDDLDTREAQGTLDESNAVRLLTVHGAKGLQFPIVFIAEADITAQLFNETIRWHPTRGLSMTLAKDDDEDGARPKPGFYGWLQAMDHDEEREEHRRLFYVACTRAADYLYICADEARSDRPADRWLDWARPALASLPPGDVDIRAPVQPDIDVLRRAPTRAPVVPPEAAEVDFVAPLAARPPVIPVRTSTPVTALLPERQVPLFAHGDGLASFRGVLAHKAIQLTYGPGECPPLIELASQMADRPLGRGDLERVVADVDGFLRRFSETELAAGLAGGLLVAHYELAFAWDWEGVPVHGVIDLAYRDAGGGWHILDFKTDRLEGKTAAEVAEPYLAQLGLYGLALERATGERPALELFLLRTGAIHECSWDEVLPAIDAARRRIDRGAELEPELIAADD